MAFPHVLTPSGIAMTFWLAVLSTGIELADSCRPHCSRSYCVSVHKVKVDFNSADEICRRSKGELFSLLPNDDIVQTLDYGSYGNFWIGLSLPDRSCSNLSAPLRGYKWTSHGQDSNVSVHFWKDSAQVCSPRCVSTSPDRKWTERPCLEKIDGFLCRTDHEHACQIQELTDYFKSSRGCSDGSCQHECTPVKDGYRCSCYKGYAPDSENPRKCKLYCGKEKCPPECIHQVCSCPDGYILSENICEDIDECEMNVMCEQKHSVCKNTLGSFKCSCSKGFILQDQEKCVPTTDSSGNVDITTAIVPAFVKPATKNSTVKGSSLSTGGFIWLWICLAVIVIVFVCMVRWYALKRQRRMQQNTTQQTQLSQGINTKL